MLSVGGSRLTLSSPDSIVAVAAASMSTRAVLDAQWRTQLGQLTELSIRRHDTDRRPPDEVEDLALDRAIDAARRNMRDTEEALTRLGRHTYGSCESCGRSIDRLRLIGLPATRICRRCQAASSEG
jgi:DnaK suppressor protein